MASFLDLSRNLPAPNEATDQICFIPDTGSAYFLILKNISANLTIKVHNIFRDVLVNPGLTVEDAQRQNTGGDYEKFLQISGHNLIKTVVSRGALVDPLEEMQIIVNSALGDQVVPIVFPSVPDFAVLEITGGDMEYAIVVDQRSNYSRNPQEPNLSMMKTHELL